MCSSDLTVSVKNPGSAGNALNAIYPQSPASIWAVGSFGNGHFDRTLIEHCT